MKVHFENITFEVDFKEEHIRHPFDIEGHLMVTSAADMLLKDRVVDPELTDRPSAPPAHIKAVTMCRIVAAWPNEDKRVQYGAAFCFSGDTFDSEKGKRLALKRTLTTGFPNFPTDPEKNAVMKLVRTAIWKAYDAILKQPNNVEFTFSLKTGEVTVDKKAPMQSAAGIGVYGISLGF